MLTELLLAADLMMGLHSGEKRCTIRKGRRDIAIGQALTIRNADDGSDTKVVYPHTVTHVTMMNCPLQWILRDGFRGRLDAVDQMKRFYPDITLDTEITVIGW